MDAPFFMSYVFPHIFTLVGALCVIFGIRTLIRAKNSKTWPTVEGVIKESDVETRRSTGSGKNRTSKTTYHAVILYEFTVEGTVCNGTRVSYGDSGSSSPFAARNIVNRYPRDKKVPVYYMPGKTRECLLEPGMKFSTFVCPIVGIIFIVAGCLMAVHLPGAIKNSNAAPAVEVPVGP